MKKIFITGGAGYVGSVLTPYLINKGHTITVFDLMLYGDTLKKDKNLNIIKGDIRNTKLLKEAIKGNEVVIHLACISNDPSFELNPTVGKEINLDAFTPLVEISKNLGVKKFIYASSSSVYGVKTEKNVDENMSLEPLTDYSKFKAMCEPILLEKTSNDFITTVVRPATLCGYAPRQRLDLSVNILTNHAVNERLIRVFGGDQYRPNLHIDDMCDAYLNLLDQPESLVNGEIFNIGAENMTIREISELVAAEIGQPLEIRVENTPDNRSYRVSSEYIKEKIGFTPKLGVREAVRDLKNAFSQGLLYNSLTDSKYFNLKRMNEVLSK